MKQIFLIGVLCFPGLSLADDLLDVLSDKKVESTLVDQQSPNDRGVDFSSLVSRRTPEMNIFFAFLNQGQMKKALFQWEAAFSSHEFSRTATGQALYGYLKYTVGLKVNGVETFFAVQQPSKVDAKVMELWGQALKEDSGVWDHADVSWNEKWKGLLPTAGEVKIRLKGEAALSSDQLKEMYRRLGSKQDQHVAIIWHLIIDLANQGEEVDAAKLLKKLLSLEQEVIDPNFIQITIARVLYQKGYLTPAIDYYQKVPKSSAYWFLAQEEMGWSYLRKGEPQNTMAIAKTLVDDHLKGAVGAEAHYLNALASLKVCDYTGVAKGLETFRRHFRPRAVILQKLVKEPKTQGVQTALSKFSKIIGRKDLGALVHELPVSLSSDRTFHFRRKRSEYLKEEAKIAETLFHQSISESSDTVGFQGRFDQLNNELKARARASENLVFERVRELAQEELAVIKQTLHKMQIVEAELVQQLVMAEQLIRSNSGKQKQLKAAETKAAHSLRFPYDGEFWFDELGQYKMDLKGGCQAKKSL